MTTHLHLVSLTFGIVVAGCFALCVCMHLLTVFTSNVRFCIHIQLHDFLTLQIIVITLHGGGWWILLFNIMMLYFNHPFLS